MKKINKNNKPFNLNGFKVKKPTPDKAIIIKLE